MTQDSTWGARGCPGAISDKLWTSVSTLANLSNDCQMVYPLLFRSRKPWKFSQVLSEEAQCMQQDAGSNFELCKLANLAPAQLSLLQANFFFACLVTCKIRALNRRINENGSTENRSGFSGTGRAPRFSILPIIWLFDLFPMPTRATRSEKDQHGQQPTCLFSSLWSWRRAIKRPPTHTLDKKIHERICFINPASVEYLNWCNR